MTALAQVFHLAVRQHRAGNLAQAEQLFLQILDIDPSHAEAHGKLGLVLQQQQRFEEASASYREALRLRPDHAGSHNNLAGVCRALGRFDEAVAGYQSAVRLQPTYAEAHNNLANVLRELGRLDEAEASIRQALHLRPDYAAAHNNLGLVLQEKRCLDDAIASFREALRLRPDHAGAHNNLGNALRDVGRLDEAAHCHREALRLQPDFAAALGSLGVALHLQGKIDEAAACYHEALRLDPQDADVHKNLGMLLLAKGDFQRGWSELEWRLRCKDACLPPFAQPRWDGSPLDGQTILLHTDHGLGDALHLVRFARLVQERGGRVLLTCPADVIPVLKGCAGIDRLIPLGEPLPAFDVHAGLLSLPLLLGIDMDRIPAEVPYLRGDPDLVERWRTRLQSVPGLRVGIVWQGNPSYKNDRWRSVRLERFAALAQVGGVRLISLQKGPGREQLAQQPGLAVDLGAELPTLADTAAAICCLDLVVGVDTALVHLAGALAVPVWLALAFAPDCRWLLQREDTPWYPTMRLFRQKKLNVWDDVFQRMAKELQPMAARR